MSNAVSSAVQLVGLNNILIRTYVITFYSRKNAENFTFCACVIYKELNRQMAPRVMSDNIEFTKLKTTSELPELLVSFNHFCSLSTSVDM